MAAVGASEPGNTTDRETRWQALLRWRWPLGGMIALAFAAGRVVESALFGDLGNPVRLLLDIVLWGLLGGLAVWVSLTWASRLERRYQAGLERALREQQVLNRQLQRSNHHLALLSEVNHTLAASLSLDQVLDQAVPLLQRLVRARAAALILTDPAGEVVARVDGSSTEELARLRAAFGINRAMAASQPARLVVIPGEPVRGIAGCLLLSLHDGPVPAGWVELYLERAAQLADDELRLLETIAAEIGEAIYSARRRSHEERALYELERAIGDERARIARDIHDGIAQSLAFMRLRVDLWIEWIQNDPGKLRGELLALKVTLREQIGELRRAIFALRPMQFDELGFVGGLERYIREFANQHSWEVHVDLSGAPPDLPPEHEAICFRIVQEALTNTAKHAAAGRIDVGITMIDAGLQIVVSDNGRGFAPGLVIEASPGRVGLRQMRERLVTVGGQLTIRSIPGGGTDVCAWFPLRTRRIAA